MATRLQRPLDYDGNLKAQTHITAGMVVVQVGQTGIEVAIAGADGATACTGFGVAMCNATGGRAVRVAVEGTVPCHAASAISVGDAVMVQDAGGRVSKCTLAGTIIVGFAEQAALNTGDVIMVRIANPGTRL